jgi:hypothetical protein
METGALTVVTIKELVPVPKVTVPVAKLMPLEVELKVVGVADSILNTLPAV